MSEPRPTVNDHAFRLIALELKITGYSEIGEAHSYYPVPRTLRSAVLNRLAATSDGRPPDDCD